MTAASPSVSAPSELPLAPGHPVVGSLLAYLRDPVGFMRRIAREQGDFVHIRVLGMESYLLSSPELVEQALVVNARKLHKDRYLRELRGLLGDGLLTSEGDVWRRQRRLMQPAFHRERVAAYGATMTECAERAIAQWRAGDERDVHREMMRLTLDIVDRTLFSDDIGEDAKRVGPAIDAVMAHFAEPLFAFLPFTAKLPLPGNVRYRRAAAELDAIFYGILRRRRAQGSPDRGDLLSMLLAAEDEDATRMSDRQIRDEIMTIYLAGHETTALALSWTFYLLSLHPAVDRKLARELRDVLGGRAPTAHDLPRLPYTEAVLLESMRLYPPAWAIGREAIEEVEIGGRRLPKGTNLWVAPCVMHRNPRFFPDPDAFDPERWEGGLQKKLPKHAYMPFGGGPRICIGNAFAMMEAVLLLATIAQRFRMSLVPGQTIEPVPSVTLRPKHGIRVRLVAREHETARAVAQPA